MKPGAPNAPDIDPHAFVQNHEEEMRVVELAREGWGIDEIASDADRDTDFVIDTLFKHKAAFRGELN